MDRIGVVQDMDKWRALVNTFGFRGMLGSS
jgi:hypothetical protein